MRGFTIKSCAPSGPPLPVWAWGLGGLILPLALLWPSSLVDTSSKPVLENSVLPAEETNREEIRLWEAVSRYWAAESVEEKLRWCRRPSHVRAALTQAHDRHALRPRKLTALRTLGEFSDGAVQGRIVQATADGATRTLLVECLEDGRRFRVDWEIENGFNEIDLQEFLAHGRGEVSSFRVYASASDYYNFGFDDPGRYFSLVLEPPDGDERVYGYVSRHSEEGRRLKSLLSGQARVPLILALRATPQSGEERQVAVLGIERDNWLLP